MSPRSALVLLVSLVAVLPACLSLAGADRALRLVANTGDREFTDFAIEKGELRLRSADGSTEPVPRGISWRLEGSLAQNWQRIYFYPDFLIITRGAIQPTTAVRTHTHGLVWAFRGEGWPNAQVNDGVVVIAWLVDGKPVWVEVAAAHLPQEYSASLMAGAARELDAATVRGVPVVLLWHEGEFVPPVQVRKSPQMSGLVAALQLGTAEEFEHVLATTPSEGLENRNDLRAIVRMASRGSRPERLEALIAASDFIDDRWNPPLILAAEYGRRENVNLLLAAGASATDKRNTGRSPAEWALGRGHLDVGMALLPERDRHRSQLALGVALEHGSVEHVATLLGRIGRVRWKDVPAESLARAWTLQDPELHRALAGAGAKAPAREPAESSEPIHSVSELDLVPVFAQRARLAGVANWRYDLSTGFGLLAEPARQLDSVWERIERSREGGGGPGLIGTRRDMWAAASLIIEPDGRASKVQMIDAVTESFARAVEPMLTASTFLPGERKGQPVRSRVTLMILAD
jgi:hypothetical protein